MSDGLPPASTPVIASSSFNFTESELDRYFKGTWKLTHCEVCLTKQTWTMGYHPKYSVIASSDGTETSTLSEQVTL